MDTLHGLLRRNLFKWLKTCAAYLEPFGRCGDIGLALSAGYITAPCKYASYNHQSCHCTPLSPHASLSRIPSEEEYSSLAHCITPPHKTPPTNSNKSKYSILSPSLPFLSPSSPSPSTAPTLSFPFSSSNPSPNKTVLLSSGSLPKIILPI